MSAPVQHPAPTTAVRVVTVLAVLLVAGVAAVVSFSHMREVADRAGEEWRAWLVPLSVDGLVVAASMTLVTRRRAGLPGGWLAWVALLGGVGASLAANIAAAEPTTTARLVAAWPAAAFAVAFELLLQQRRAPVVDPVGARVGEVPPGGRPVGDGPGDDGTGTVGEPDAQVPSVGALDPLSARVGALVAAARTEGRPVGRRTVARELGVSEHAARRLLGATNGTTGCVR